MTSRPIFWHGKNIIFLGCFLYRSLAIKIKSKRLSNLGKNPHAFSCNKLLLTICICSRHLVNERNREEMDEVSNRKLTSMALDVSRGLSYLAELKYVHRDVACRNCLVNSSRVVKLADFGMARPMYENDYYRFNKKGEKDTFY